MKTLAIDDANYVVSDEIAHHVQSYQRLLAAFGRKSDVMIPIRTGASEQGTVSITLSRDTPDPVVTDYTGGLTEPDDLDGLADALEEEALTMLHDLSELYDILAADWQEYTRQRRH